MMLSKSLKYKLVHLLSSQHNGGFALVKVLTWIAVIGVLGAIAMTFFSNKGNVCRLSEAKNTVIGVNSAQLSYFTRKKVFARDIDSLGVIEGTRSKNGIEVKEYDYTIEAGKNAAFSYAIPREYARKRFSIFQWDEKGEPNSKRAYVGAVFLVPTKQTDDVEMLIIACEANTPGRIQPPDPFLKNGEPNCHPGSQPVGN